ncbi:MAG TPA: hypothetical protein VNB94_05010 [Mycobacteriales bacterium]|nr:hypothetical protein [Mycobacteriales bacterium]
MAAPIRPNGSSPKGTIDLLFDSLCLRWVREADVVVQQTGALPTTLILLPREKTADEVAIRLDGLRGNLVERSDAIVAELRPQTAVHDPAGLVLLLEARLGVDGSATADPSEAHSGQGSDAAVVYVTLGRPGLRRALAFRVRHGAAGTSTIERLDADPPVEHFAWLDALLFTPT